MESIAEITTINQRFVERWAEREGTANMPGQGRPREITREQAEEILKDCKKKRFGSARKSAHKTVNIKTGKTFDPSTISRFLHTEGLTNVGVRKTPLLTDDHRAVRWGFCDMYKKEDWKRWICTILSSPPLSPPRCDGPMREGVACSLIDRAVSTGREVV